MNALEQVEIAQFLYEGMRNHVPGYGKPWQELSKEDKLFWVNLACVVYDLKKRGVL